jgi:hypothetical protein
MSYDGHSGSSFGWTMQQCCYYLNNIEKWEKKNRIMLNSLYSIFLYYIT